MDKVYVVVEIDQSRYLDDEDYDGLESIFDYCKGEGWNVEVRYVQKRA